MLFVSLICNFKKQGLFVSLKKKVVKKNQARILCCPFFLRASLFFRVSLKGKVVQKKKYEHVSYAFKIEDFNISFAYFCFAFEPFLYPLSLVLRRRDTKQGIPANKKILPLKKKGKLRILLFCLRTLLVGPFVVFKDQVEEIPNKTRRDTGQQEDFNGKEGALKAPYTKTNKGYAQPVSLARCVF